MYLLMKAVKALGHLKADIYLMQNIKSSCERIIAMLEQEKFMIPN